jgi:hypothetical protein
MRAAADSISLRAAGRFAAPNQEAIDAMSKTERFILRTLGRHLRLVGLTYAAGWGAMSFFVEDSHPPYYVLAALLAGAIYPFFALWWFPIPANPLQQLMRNLFIPIYSLLASLPAVAGLIQFGLGIFNADHAVLLAAVHMFFCCGFICDSDEVPYGVPNRPDRSNWILVMRDLSRRD